jgi:hypothetical protein
VIENVIANENEKGNGNGIENEREKEIAKEIDGIETPTVELLPQIHATVIPAEEEVAAVEVEVAQEVV